MSNGFYNTVTYFGRYPDIWEFYRTEGLLSAIQKRDEKLEFDWKLNQIDFNNVQTYKNLAFDKEERSTIRHELDLAIVKSVANLLETWPPSIRQYYRDHNATREEAEVICKLCLQYADKLRQIKYMSELEKVMDELEDFKNQVDRYQHPSKKYRWSSYFQNQVLDKLRSIR